MLENHDFIIAKNVKYQPALEAFYQTAGAILQDWLALELPPTIARTKILLTCAIRYYSRGGNASQRAERSAGLGDVHTRLESDHSFQPIIRSLKGSLAGYKKAVPKG